MLSRLAGEIIQVEYENVIQCFLKSVEKYEDKVAIICEKNYSYKELDELSNQIANYLTNKGIQNREIIGIKMEKNVNFIATILAILKLNATCMILGEECTEQFRILGEKLQLDYVIFDELNYNKSVHFYPNFIKIEKLDKYGKTFKFGKGESRDIAFIFYTSGTTGKPKKVKISHSNIINDTSIETARPCLTSEDVFLLTSPKATLRITGEIFYPLNAGASIVMISDEESQNRDSIVNAIQKHRVTVMFVVPTMLKEIARYKRISSCDSLRMIQSMGEMLDCNVINCFTNNLNAELYNIYGQTEMGMCSIHKVLQSERDENCVGKPVPNRCIYILNKNMKVVPIDEEGEIFVSGEGLIYSEEQRDKYMLNNMQLFRTGDRGKIDSEGRLIHCGRNDNICKVNGKRINLNLIENTILKYPNIANAVVVFFQDKNRKCLVAVLEKSNKLEELSFEELKNYLKHFLPSYMIPKRYYVVENIFKGKNGKISRKATKEYVEERFWCVSKNISHRVTDVIASILEISPVEIDTSKSLLEIGLNSLQVIEFQVEYEKLLGKNIELEDLVNVSIEELL